MTDPAEEEGEWLWAILLVSGLERLSAADRRALAQWLQTRDGDHSDLLPDSLDQAAAALAFARSLLDDDAPGEAALLSARLALAAYDSLAEPSSGQRAAAVVVAAHAALATTSPLQPHLPDDVERFLARVRCLAIEDLDEVDLLATRLLQFGVYLSSRRRDAEAESALRRVLLLQDRLPLADDDERAVAREELAVVLASQDRVNEAEPLLRTAIDIRHHSWNEARKGRWRAWLGLSMMLWRIERWSEAAQAFGEAEAAARFDHGPASAQADACAADRRSFERAWLSVREGGRLFAWALRQATGTPFERAIAALTMVAEQLTDAEEAATTIAEAARLRARAGEIDGALALVEQRLMAVAEAWDGEGVVVDAVDTLLRTGRRDEAAQVLRRSFLLVERFQSHARLDGDPGLRDLVDRLEELDHAGIRALIADSLPGDKRNLAREHDLREAVSHGDVARCRSILDAWQWTESTPDDWLLRDLGRLFATIGDMAMAQHLASMLRSGDRPHLAVDVLLAAGDEDGALQVLAGIAGGWARAGGLAAAAVHAAGRGDGAQFVRLADAAIADIDPECVATSGVLDRLAEGARLCLSRDESERWSVAVLSTDAARRSFMAGVDGRPSGASSPAPAIAHPLFVSALEARDWDGAICHLTSSGNGYYDLLMAERLAEPAAADGRCDIAARAMRFALDKLAGPFADATFHTTDETALRLGTARQLGEKARLLLKSDDCRALADVAFTQAAGLADLGAARALVVAGGHACRPAPVAAASAVKAR